MKLRLSELRQIIREEFNVLTEQREYKVSPAEPFVSVNLENGKLVITLVTGGRAGAMTTATVEGQLDDDSLEMLQSMQK